MIQIARFETSKVETSPLTPIRTEIASEWGNDFCDLIRLQIQIAAGLNRFESRKPNPCIKFPNLPFTAFLDFLAFFLFKKFLAILSFFLSFPRILGVRRAKEILAFLVVFLAVLEKRRLGFCGGLKSQHRKLAGCNRRMRPPREPQGH